MRQQLCHYGDRNFFFEFHRQDLSITNGLQFGPASGTIQNGTLDIAPGASLVAGRWHYRWRHAGTATINLSGGELNLGGNNITPGSNSNNFNFNFSGGTLQNVGAENANINFSGGTVYTTNPNSIFNGAFTGTGGILTTSGSGLTLAGTTGNSNLTLSVGSGTVILSQSNGNAAAAIANAAAGSTVQLRGANQISSTGSVTLGGGTLDLNTYSAAVSSLSGSGTIDTVAGGSADSDRRQQQRLKHVRRHDPE